MDAVTQADVHETVVVLGYQADRVRGVLEGRPVRFAHNPGYADGMASSLRAGIAAMERATDGVMVCLSDLPLIRPSELDLLIAAFREAPPRAICVPTHGGRRGNPVLLAMHYKPEILQQARGPVGGCKGVVARHPERVREVAMATDHVLRDIDTLDDYRGLTARPTAG